MEGRVCMRDEVEGAPGVDSDATLCQASLPEAASTRAEGPPDSIEKLLDIEPLALNAERRLFLQGYVLRRKVLSRSLAFCTLKVERHAEIGCSWRDGAPEPKRLSVAEAESDNAVVDRAEDQAQCGLVPLCFMAGLDDASGEFATQENDLLLQPDGLEPGRSTPWAAHPGRKGDLPVGTRMRVSVMIAPTCRKEEPLVRRWHMLPKEEMELSELGLLPSSSSVARDFAIHHAARDAVNRAAKQELLTARRGPALCKIWSLKRKASDEVCCDESCTYRHHFLGPEEEQRVAATLAAREKARAAVEQEQSAYENVQDAPHGNDKAEKSRRASRFASWLLAQYGREALRAGSGVLDVAGGQGDLSWALSVDADVPSTLIDPGLRRGGELKSWQRRALRKSGKERFAHIAVEFSEANFSADRSSAQQGGGEGSQLGGSPYAALLSNASLVVGLHPDEATEAIVDVALASGRKFAVVPCCVFAHKFPDRQLSQGQPVRTLNQFCTYLMRKDPRIQEALLDFQGRNKVLYIP